MRKIPRRRKRHLGRRPDRRFPVPTRKSRRLTQRELKRVRVALSRPPCESRIRGDRWTAQRITRYLRLRFGLQWSPRYAVRALREYGVRFRLTRAREPKLSAARIRTLRGWLRRKPTEVGLAGEGWSRARVAQLIQLRFGVHYTSQHIGRLLDRWGIKLTLSNSPRRLTTEQANTLRTLLAESPLNLGMARRAWTRPLIAALIAERFGVQYHSQSIPPVLARWNIALYRAPGGRARALNVEQAAELTRILSLAPREAGLAGNVWTARQVAQLVEQRFGIRYSVLSTRRALARWNIHPIHTARRGGTTYINTTQVTAIAAALARSPRESGYECPTWSRELVARFIHDRLGAHYSVDSITRILRRHGLHLRPRAVLGGPAQASPELPPETPSNASTLEPLAARAPSQPFVHSKTSLSLR